MTNTTLSPNINKTELETLGYTTTGPLLSAAALDDLRAHLERLRERGAATARGNNAFFCDPEATDADFMRHLTTPAILQVVMEALGPDVDLFGSQFAYKQARGGSQFAWHQDSGYGHIAPAEYLTLWLALDDATVENGTIWVMPGSHQAGRLTHKRSETNPNDMIGYPAEAPYQGVPVEGQRPVVPRCFRA